MGLPAIEGKKSAKKRWRIAIRSKSKSKVSSKDDPGIVPTTPESSDWGSDSHGSCEESSNERLVIELPAPMSDVDGSDDDDDVYLDNDGCTTDEIVDLPIQSESISADGEGLNTSSCSSAKPEGSSIVSCGNNDDHDENYDNYEDDIERHRMERDNCPHFSKGLHKIVEEIQHNGDTDNEEIDNIVDGVGHDGYEITTETTTPNKKLIDRVVPTPTIESNNNKNDGNTIDLPTAKELSKKLCKIVATEHYSGEESLRALEKLSEWARTQDSTILKHFLTYGAVVKVIDFLNEQIENQACAGMLLMECVQKAADVICNVCFVGKHGINEDIAVVNATVVVKYNGIETLLLASNEYSRSDKTKPLALKAAEGVWNAIMNVYCNAEAAVTKDVSMLVLGAAIEMMSAVGSIDHPLAAETLANIFNTLYRIAYHDFVSKEDFQQMDILKHCLNVFKRDVTSSEGDEELLEEAISFFYGCHEKDLFDKSLDYERVLPLCVMGLREFAQDNQNIREWASKLLDGACSNIEKKESILMAEGAIEALAPFLTSKYVSVAEKEELRKLIRKIVSA
mmetsp:Transcript_26614/g.58571  ORF Transcript_26614/g.58571 Transcript_26614/m.58571 type:complete len:566 (-) Transcript_26614:394-2091(-)